MLNDANKLADYLESRLAGSGRAQTRSSLAPVLAYGRHRGPARVNSRVAAVAVSLYQRPTGEWIIPLTLRPKSLRHHGGQISLPGGRAEPGESLVTTAAREFQEELGLPPRIERFCGELPSLYVFASDHWVHPLVMILERPDRAWQPDPVEVAAVIELPLRDLLDPSRLTDEVNRRAVIQGARQVGELSFRTPGIRIGQHLIWGATALVLDELAQILRPS